MFDVSGTVNLKTGGQDLVLQFGLINVYKYLVLQKTRQLLFTSMELSQSEVEQKFKQIIRLSNPF